ncbi:uncharacterized protein DUF4439 [Herbihabitans rhizosphaerae]|uniref:Uncharacterized protein DUF4439 n=1 Tax=Herbihabitans rhizosphaerae TaxID=1872711 RepID=A0A4V2ERD6_9PSEU|nr:ferritin-like domain-containing protein [Herbihabitans rhizosphaerae]RZS30482.1 uncharacterized protein DUF4439 [Herbihabitans rhizosphaerae]
MSGQPKPLPADSVEAVQRALGAEHAALWVYSLVSAFLPPSFDAPLREGTTAHRARRDATERALAASGATPRPAEPGYRLPQPVTDQATAITSVVAAETDATVAWRAVLERTDDAELRRAALEALTNAAVRGTRWRKTGRIAPTFTAFPGKP